MLVCYHPHRTLYTADVGKAPLYDADNKLKFFIGGQINCSTTIRSNTDVLKILSMSDDYDEEKEVAISIPETKSRRRFFGFTRKESSSQIPQSTKRVEVRPDGMEQGLLKQIEKMNFRTQMELFYTAYSKVGNSAILRLVCYGPSADKS